MAGSDVAVTDGRIADLVIEYAKLLGRAGTTDTVVLPVVVGGVADEATFLVGPASQITVMSSHDESLEGVPLPNVPEVVEDLLARIGRLPGGQGRPVMVEEPPHDPTSLFDDYGL
jgi:hypothetical protein